MDLLQLHYFSTVARMEHMTKAAQSLQIAQPALSMMIARLEADLGVPLFDRDKRQIKLNAYGKAFLAKVNIALTALEDGKRELNDMSGIERGQIKLGVTTLNRLSNILSPFVQAHPNVKFRITQITTEEMKIELLESGEIDLCLTAALSPRPGIISLTLITEEIRLAVPLTHRLAHRSSIRLEELAEESFISLKPGNSIRDLMDIKCAEAGFTPDYVCEGDDTGSINSLVRSGIGIAFVPQAAMNQVKQLTFLRIENEGCYLNIQLTWPEKRYLSLAARSFRDFVVEQYKAHYHNNFPT